MEEGIFSINGRISRSTYLVRWACIKIPYYIIYWIIVCLTVFFSGISMYGLLSGTTGTEIIAGSMLIVMAGIGLLAFIIHLVLLLPQIVKRLHDMDKSGQFALVFLLGWILVSVLEFIPIIGIIFSILWLVLRIIFFLILVISEGTVGNNQYGEDPEKRISYDKSGI